MAFLPDIQVGTAVVADASDSCYRKAYTHKMLEWFQLPWMSSWDGTCIVTKELLPFVMAAAVGKSHGTEHWFNSGQTIKQWGLWCQLALPSTHS